LSCRVARAICRSNKANISSRSAIDPSSGKTDTSQVRAFFVHQFFSAAGRATPAFFTCALI